MRAGLVTPQPADEAQFRTELNLPAPASEVSELWKEQGGVRQPITLQSDDGKQPGPVPLDESSAP